MWYGGKTLDGTISPWKDMPVGSIYIYQYPGIGSVWYMRQVVADATASWGIVLHTNIGLSVYGTQVGAQSQAQAFTNGVIAPTVLGGTDTKQTLIFQTTSGVGATGARHIFKVGNNGATEAMTILNSGNVGIGTTAPISKLHISVSTPTTTEVQSLTLFSSDSLAADKGGTIGFGGIYSGTSNTTWATIRGLKATETDGQVGGYLAFSTRPTTGSTAESMRINSAGNVGIGTTGPTNLLSLGGNAARIFWLERHTTADTAGNTLTITAGGATTAATDKAGGALILQGGLSTGSAESGVTIQGCVAGAGGTTDRTQTTAIQVLGNKVAFFAQTPVVRQTELTDELTTLTFTAPGTPDYAIADLVQNTGFGFVAADEGQTVLSVIANLQTRVNELETKLTAYGLLVDAD